MQLTVPIRHALLLTVLASCGGCFSYGWSVPALVRPEVTQPYLDNQTFDVLTAWKEEVAVAIELWNAPLVDRGCQRPYTLTNSTDANVYTIRLVTRKEWEYPGTVGRLFSGDPDEGGILIRERRPARSNLPTLLHELGHGMGLLHNDATDSVMTLEVRDVVVPSDEDIVNAATALGC